VALFPSSSPPTKYQASCSALSEYKAQYRSDWATIGMTPAHKSGCASAISQAASPPIECPDKNTRSESIANRRLASRRQPKTAACSRAEYSYLLGSDLAQSNAMTIYPCLDP